MSRLLETVELICRYCDYEPSYANDGRITVEMRHGNGHWTCPSCGAENIEEGVH